MEIFEKVIHCADLVLSVLHIVLSLFLVPSQVIVGRTISKKQMLMSVCTKIGIQLNCKLGGEAWAVEIPVSTVSYPL